MSWLRDESGYDLFFNRDERRTRVAAAPPEVLGVGTTSVLAPRDGEGGGSWIAANEHGVTLALLNGYLGADGAAAPAVGEWISRGRLVMDLADCRTADAAERRLRSGDLASFRSFHLVVLDPRTALLASWRDGALTCSVEDAFESPLISSSFEFAAVAESRRGLYRKLTGTAGAGIDSSLAYHRSHHPERGAYSPCMHREDARTVSFTWVRVDAASVRMRYSPDAPCRGWPPGPPLKLDLEPSGPR